MINIKIGLIALFIILILIMPRLYVIAMRRMLRRRGWHDLNLFLKMNNLTFVDIQAISKATGIRQRLKLVGKNYFIDGESTMFLLHELRKLNQKQMTEFRGNIENAGIAAVTSTILTFLVSEKGSKGRARSESNDANIMNNGDETIMNEAQGFFIKGTYECSGIELQPWQSYDYRFVVIYGIDKLLKVLPGVQRRIQNDDIFVLRKNRMLNAIKRLPGPIFSEEAADLIGEINNECEALNIEFYTCYLKDGIIRSTIPYELEVEPRQDRQTWRSVSDPYSYP